MINKLKKDLSQYFDMKNLSPAQQILGMKIVRIGLLTVPYALSSGGWLSLLLFFVVAAMTFYTRLLLKTCLDADLSIRSYLDIAERAFGKTGRIIVTIIMNSELYLVGTGLLILEADNLHKLFSKFMIKIGALTIEGTQSFVFITALVILPSMLLTDLSILSYVSATGVFFCLIIFISVVCVGAFNGVGFHEKGNLCIVCFAGHPVVPSVYTSMRDAYQFNKVLLSSFTVTTITYIIHINNDRGVSHVWERCRITNYVESTNRES
ncbi:hypothetical protein CsSME_00025869 [Camellia sinensis var. sinensis]